jgi:hypothetical protein
MQLDQIDLDRYMPPASDQAPAATESGGSKASADPFEALRPLDFEGEFRIG